MARNDQPIDFQFWNNINATPNDFRLNDGVFGLTLKATAWGTATLQQLQPDGSTYISVMGTAGPVAADGYMTLQLSAGQYRLSLSGVTGLIGKISLIAKGSG